MIAVLDLGLAAAILAVAAWTLWVRSDFSAVVGFVSYGLLLALAWVRLGAIDVALTEAAIGAGATGFILLLAATRLRGGPGGVQPDVDAATPSRGQRWAIGVLCGIIGAALAAAMLALPEPAPSLAAEAARHLPELGVGNPITGVLMAYRGLDTLLEAVVVVFAVVAVWSMAPDDAWGQAPGPRFPAQHSGPLALLTRVLVPIGIVTGIYIAWVGADAPGGKFQGGTILAAMWVLAWVAGLAPMPSVTSAGLRWAVVAGPLTFLAVGLLGYVWAGGFLAYPPAFAKPLILAIEAAMTISVGAGLAMLVAGPPERPDQGRPGRRA
ncbi:hydrogenase subunit MbhD domain-containing protein [Dankookia sp. GCM10030260]|uniref:hydrogenase subunit MbhD domain-containing protein n=1 Tax=Dankookia sp. GCM10030260 TaxID=3273390 RepID=UPI00361ADE9E